MLPAPPLLLDVCGTLYTPNTSVAFLRHLGATIPGLRGPWLFGAARAWLCHHRGASSGDCMRARIGMLAGRSQDWVRTQAGAFVDILEAYSIPASLARLDEALASGRETWLISATFDELLQAIAKRHPGVFTLGSRLAYANGVGLGQYEEFLLETGKLAALSRKMPADRITASEFVTDDLAADADLAAAVRIVHHVQRGSWT